MDLNSIAGAKLHPARPAHVSVPGPVTGDDFERLQAEIRAISGQAATPAVEEPETYGTENDGGEQRWEPEDDPLVNAVARVQPSDLDRVKETAVSMLAGLRAKASQREDAYERDRATLVHARIAARTEVVQIYRRRMEAIKEEAHEALERFDATDATVQALRDLDAANERARAEDVRLNSILRTMKDG